MMNTVEYELKHISKLMTRFQLYFNLHDRYVMSVYDIISVPIRVQVNRRLDAVANHRNDGISVHDNNRQQYSSPPPIRETTPLLRTRGIFDPPTWCGHRGMVVGVFDCGPTGRRFQFALCRSTAFPRSAQQWPMTG